ncbi:MAG: nucleotidyltransferase domain-containing protein, partial [Candidatus Dormibacteraceae bacterium]
MNVAQPATALISPLANSILNVLIGTTRPLAGREITRLAAHGSQEGVRRALGRLSEHGLVERIEHRGSTLYTLNRDHLAMPVVNLLTSMRTDLIRKIRAVVTSWSPQPIHLSMFGSAARADGGTESDIDLLLIRPEGVESVDEGWNRQMNNLRESIQLWTGNRVSYT